MGSHFLISILIIIISFAASFSSDAAEELKSLGRCDLPAIKKFDQKRDKIAIVGAGITGLSIARKLISEKVPPGNITIIEKEKNAGGKVSSLKYKNNNYDLGALFILPRFDEINKLMTEFGLTSRVVDEMISVDVNQVENPHCSNLNEQEKTELKNQSKRYLQQYSSYSLSDKTWLEFIKENNLELLDKGNLFWISGCGFNTYKANSTNASIISQYIMTPANLEKPALPQLVNEGFQVLLKRMAEDLKQKGVGFKFNTLVKKIIRNSSRKMKIEAIRNKKKIILNPDHIFYTADLSYLPTMINGLQECEINTYNNIIHTDYRSILVEAKEIPKFRDQSLLIMIHPYIDGKNVNGKLEDYFNEPVVAVKPHRHTNVYLLYLFGLEDSNNVEIKKNVIQFFKKLNVDSKVLATKKWKYFPRVSGDLKVRQENLLKLHGVGGLWLAGEAFTFPATDFLYLSSQKMVNLFLENKN
ncbi:MAG: oleate hydratase [Rhizobacter sp.]|nr:oleate hydratase [Bacteriovorax sp.]